MNPLKIPFRTEKPQSKSQITKIPSWGLDTGKLPPAPERPPREEHVAYRSPREEEEVAAKRAKSTLKVQVQGVKGVQSGTYTFPYDPSQNLGDYLTRVKLKMAAVRNAIYDMGNLEKGRLRLSYIPQPDSTIFIGPPQRGPNSHLQSSEYAGEGAERVAARMGGGKKEVEISVGQGQFAKSSVKRIDSLDLEQF